MRYAIISDIHSNIEALTAFFKAAEKLKVDKTVCLGDMVGYNPNPNECVDLVRENEVACVMGNHDSRASGVEEPTDFNPQAALAIYWTRNALTDENKEFLKNLPRKLMVDDRFLAVHGWVNDTDRYVFSAGDAAKNFELVRKEKPRVNICFFGHTHVAITYLEAGGSVALNADSRLSIDPGVDYLINPGGLGQPRDRDPRAPFAIYDTEKREVTFHRVEYDFKATAQKILDAGLPQRLAERLKLGW